MAAPANLTAQNLSGTWLLNKSLSDSTEVSLALQGISWIARKTLAKAPITLTIKHYTDEAGVIHFDTVQKTLGRTVEQSTSLDGKAVETDHPLFGKISQSHRWIAVSSIEEEFLKEALEAGTTDVVELVIRNDEADWTSRQVIAVEVINGERRHTRRVVVTGNDEVVKTRMVYDFQA